MITDNPGVVLVDDHVLLRNGLASLIRSFGRFDVLFEASDGKDLIRKLNTFRRPDIILLDIGMPEMDGYETACYLREHFPEIRVLALTMTDTDSSVARMLNNGAKGYVLKDIDAHGLEQALDSIADKGSYYTETVTEKLIDTVSRLEEPGHRHFRNMLTLNDRELEFMKLVCTEWTYKEIADRMYLSPRTIDGYRDALFEKLNVRTRVGLAMFAVKNGIVQLD